MHLEVLERTEDCVLARWDRLLLIRWRDQVTVAGIGRARAQAEALQPRLGPVVLFSLVPARSSKPPDPATQLAIRELTGQSSRWMAGVAVVFEGGGFMAASIMALTMKLGGSGKASTPTRVFRTLEEAVGWAEQRLGSPGPSVPELRAALAEIS